MKTISSDQFRQRTREAARRGAIPLRVMFELTYRCNFSCGHCYVPARWRRRYRARELSTDEVARVLVQLREAGCLYLGFTGGEPFLRRDILKIVRRACTLGFEVMIYTNGSRITREAARELSRFRLNKIDITLPAASEEVFRRVTGVRGARRKVYEAVHLLKAAGVPVGLKACVLRSNRIEIPVVGEFAAALGCELRLDDTLSPRLDGSTAPYRYRDTRHKTQDTRYPTPGIGQELRAKSRGPHTCSSDVLRPPSDGVFFCGAGRTQASITPSGELNICGSVHFPGIPLLKTPFPEAWARVRREVGAALGRDTWDCAACDEMSYCGRCPALGWLHAGRFGACDPDSRERARSIKDLHV